MSEFCLVPWVFVFLLIFKLQHLSLCILVNTSTRHVLKLTFLIFRRSHKKQYEPSASVNSKFSSVYSKHSNGDDKDGVATIAHQQGECLLKLRVVPVRACLTHTLLFLFSTNYFWLPE